VYAYISYALLMTAYTAVNIPYSALAGTMTSDKDERSGLQSWRFGMAMVGGFLVTVSIWPLSGCWAVAASRRTFSSGSPSPSALLALVGVVALFGCFAWTRERTYPGRNGGPGAVKPKPVGGCEGHVRQQPVARGLAGHVHHPDPRRLQGNVKPYFIKYYIEHDLTGLFSVTENFMALYMGLTMLAGVAGVVWPTACFWACSGARSR
jgi:GPH family glycoside/pentoside/hexuronide:cation symporter